MPGGEQRTAGEEEEQKEGTITKQTWRENNQKVKKERRACSMGMHWVIF